MGWSAGAVAVVRHRKRRIKTLDSPCAFNLNAFAHEAVAEFAEESLLEGGHFEGGANSDFRNQISDIVSPAFGGMRGGGEADYVPLGGTSSAKIRTLR